MSAEQFPAGTLPRDDRATMRVNFAFQGAGPEYQQWITALFKPPEIASANIGERNDSLTDSDLGLLLARAIVEAHAGHLWAEACDTPGTGQAGIIFHVLLPLG